MTNENKFYPLLLYRADYCPKCRQNRIEAFDYWNNPLKLRRAADIAASGRTVPEDYFKRGVYKLRCKSCGTNYRMRWYRGCPFPVSEDSSSYSTFKAVYNNE